MERTVHGSRIARRRVFSVALLCAMAASTAEAQQWERLATGGVTQVPDVDPGTILFDAAANELRRFHALGGEALTGFAFDGTDWPPLTMLFLLVYDSGRAEVLLRSGRLGSAGSERSRLRGYTQSS